MPVGVVLPLTAANAAAVANRGAIAIRFERPDCTSAAAPMEYYQQQQLQQPPQPVPAPNYPATPAQNAYDPYSANTSTDNYIQYPTAHMFQQHTTTEVTTTATLGYSSDPVTKAVMDNIFGKLPTKKNQLLYRCDTCNMDFSGQSVLDMHLTGAKHAKKVKSLQILNDLSASGQLTAKGSTTLRCDACGIEANSSQQLQTHLSGNKHKQRMAKLVNSQNLPMPVPAPVQPLMTSSQIDSALMPPPPPPPQLPYPGEPVVPGEESPASLRNYFCDVCELNLNSAQQLSQHQESRKHKEKATGRLRHSPYGSSSNRFKQNSKRKKKKKSNPLAYLTPLSSSFVRGDML
ncbi:zinc finger protein 385B-like [Neocloeon triangulifer]|uniref:zinc finger protein 385B-like n=1 Tax=Neocloeon triangulifer TaxID=2078957 RepID=UPI00286FAA2E|nr:zinc finger protein 385B-like [Neocloeon triangulifer]